MTPLVSVIIPHHLNQNQRYLDACLESLEHQKSGLEILVTSSAPQKPSVPDFVRLHWPIDSKHYAEKINKSIKLTDPRSKYVLLGSDDLIFSHNSVHKLAQMCADYAVILNPVSNCDNQYLYEGSFSIDGFDVPRFLRMEDMPEKAWRLIKELPMTGPQIMFPQRYVCFYCSMIPRKVLDMVGPLDENFRTGFEDTDYCYRAKLKGIQCAITPFSYVHHWGGVTSSLTVTDYDKSHNPTYFKAKHGIDYRQL